MFTPVLSGSWGDFLFGGEEASRQENQKLQSNFLMGGSVKSQCSGKGKGNYSRSWAK